MRRVYDDAKLAAVASALENAFRSIKADEVSEYSHGMYRAEVRKVKESLLRKVNGIMFGSVTHAHGIGNNNAIEIVCTGDPVEEQICGLLHLTNDMFGSVIFWVSDIDGNRKTRSYKLTGIDKKDAYCMEHHRYAMVMR